jgi:hypothetical protein
MCGGGLVSSGDQGRQRLIEAIALVTASLDDDPETYLTNYLEAMLDGSAPAGELNERLVGGLFTLVRVLLDSVAASTGLSANQILQQLGAFVAGSAPDGPASAP